MTKYNEICQWDRPTDKEMKKNQNENTYIKIINKLQFPIMYCIKVQLTFRKHKLHRIDVTCCLPTVFCDTDSAGLADLLGQTACLSSPKSWLLDPTQPKRCSPRISLHWSPCSTSIASLEARRADVGPGQWWSWHDTWYHPHRVREWLQPVQPGRSCTLGTERGLSLIHI